MDYIVHGVAQSWTRVSDLHLHYRQNNFITVNPKTFSSFPMEPIVLVKYSFLAMRLFLMSRFFFVFVCFVFLISSLQARVCFVWLVLFSKCRFPCSISRYSASEGVCVWWELVGMGWG